MNKKKALQMVESFVALHPEYEGNKTDLRVFVEFLGFMGVLDLKKATSVGEVSHEERKLNNFLDSDYNLAKKRYLDNE